MVAGQVVRTAKDSICLPWGNVGAVSLGVGGTEGVDRGSACPPPSAPGCRPRLSAGERLGHLGHLVHHSAGFAWALS